MSNNNTNRRFIIFFNKNKTEASTFSAKILLRNIYERNQIRICMLYSEVYIHVCMYEVVSDLGTYLPEEQ